MTVAEELEADPSAAVCAWCAAPLRSGAGEGHGLVRCERCGAGTTDPWPSEAYLREAYGDWYRPAGGRFSGPGDLVLRFSRGALARRLDRIAPQGPVLDVGAGDGTLLDALRRRGREALGLELVSTRPDIRAADIADVDGAFAAIVFWHSLEHLARPSAALDRSAALLRPGGVLVVAVPNLDSLQARLFGERWFALDLPRHLVHLPAGTLLRRLEEIGLQVRRRSHLRGGQVVFGWLHGLVGALPGRPDLYEAIRRPAARSRPLRRGERPLALAAAVPLLAPAAACGAAEALARRGGSVYVEARRG